MSDIKLYQGDCLEIMKQIPYESVDLILCDLPYGVLGKNPPSKWTTRNEIKKWDTPLNTTNLFELYSKILKNNGRIILFSQGEYTAELIKNYSGKDIKFCQKAIWLKNRAGNILGCKKQLVSIFEDIIIFNKNYEYNSNNISDILLRNITENGFSKKDVYKIIGSSAVHYFSKGKQFRIPTKQNFNLLKEAGILTLDYNKIKNTQTKNTMTFNMLETENQIPNVFEFKKESSNFHPTQKPIKLLERLIQIYSNENDTILDNCMGSGSTGVACKNLNRNFIGIELDEHYFNIAKERIENE